MKWSNIKLIYRRELRDQLRDRRTLFTIAILPLLLYPFMGMTFLQVASFLKDHTAKVLIIGHEEAQLNGSEISLFSEEEFNPRFLGSLSSQKLQLAFEKKPTKPEFNITKDAKERIKAEEFDAIIYFPDSFSDNLKKMLAEKREPQNNNTFNEEIAEDPLEPLIYYNTTKDKSSVAYQRINLILGNWKNAITIENLDSYNVPETAINPFTLQSKDTADEALKQAATWSKILPFIALIWALTGAFYPAIDLCAGEKERGTLETLLSSPAQRQEIVWGKLLTVITFSISTAVLNLLSMGITGTFVMKQLALGGGLPNLGMPPVSALFWLGLVLIPISALFSALALAIASFARSSKEGQYYLMPLLMGTLPLMMLPMMPAVELNLGMSLIPISGVLLLLKNLIEGEFQQALIYCLPVIGVTGVCCWIAIRWATNQFQNEEVLFSGSERFSVGVWLKHLIRDRGATPGFSEALMCAMAILLIRFFANAFMAGSSQTIDFSNIVSTTLTIQLAFILTPALIMTVFLTTNYRKTLSLKIPKLRFAIGMFALAVFMHPATFLLNMGIQALYPIDVGKLPVLVELVKEFQSKDIITLILLIGVTPAICEELAFRGFIFSGFRHSGRKWVAIVLSAFFFGATHGILQQSISAAVLGCLLGAIVIKTGSIFPAMIYHCTHNSLSVFFLKMPQWFDQEGILPYFVSEQTQETFTGDFMVGYIYNTPVMVLFTIAAFAILLWLYLQPSANTEEEQLHEKISHQND